MIIAQIINLILLVALLIVIIGGVTIAATMGGGLLYGLAVLVLLLGIAYVWGTQ